MIKVKNIKNKVKLIKISEFTSVNNHKFKNIDLFYQIFGKSNNISEKGVLICHAFTGSSNVCQEDGWWHELVGYNKRIDLTEYTVIAFNIPGNQLYNDYDIIDYTKLTTRDVCELFILGLKKLNIHNLYCAIGVSLGGGIVWEMAVSHPNFFDIIIPIASDYKASDWIIGLNKVQKQILENSTNPIKDARMMAMLFYRTPESYKQKFLLSKDKQKNMFSVESYLLHQGDKLKKKFMLNSYKVMINLMNSMDILKNRVDDIETILSNIKSEILMIGIDSDWLFPCLENKQTLKIAKKIGVKKIDYKEIKSIHGHDAFFIEIEKLSFILKDIFPIKKTNIKVIVFSPSSLINKDSLKKVIKIIKTKSIESKIICVISPFDKSIKLMNDMLKNAINEDNINTSVKDFHLYHKNICPNTNIDKEIKEVKDVLNSITKLGEYSKKVEAYLISMCELISSKIIFNQFKDKANLVDIKSLIITNNDFLNAQPNNLLSEENIKKYFHQANENIIHIVPASIGSNEYGQTTRLGLNSADYTASIIANYTNSKVVEIWSNINGIFTADPKLVPNAKIINTMSFKEANEISFISQKILNAKNIIPLIEKKIPIKILNTFQPDKKGTTINYKSSSNQIKAISVIDNLCLIGLEGKGLLGNIGIDARIFNTLKKNNISVRTISQTISERGIGLIVDLKNAEISKYELEKEFKQDIENFNISKIYINKDVCIISAIGNMAFLFTNSLKKLYEKNINIYLIANTINNKEVSIVINQKNLKTAVNIIHEEIIK